MIFGMKVKWKDIKVKFAGQGNMSKVKVTRSKTIIMAISMKEAKEANEEYDCTDTMRGVFKAYMLFHFK